ncbi:MAG: histidine kinase, partial [Bacteroidota bacterium]
MRDLLAALVIGAITGVLLYGYLAYSEASLPALSPRASAISGVAGVIIALALWQVAKYLNTLFPWRRSISVRMTMGVLVSWLVLAVLVVAPFHLFAVDESELTIKLLIILGIAGLVFNVLYFAVYTYYHFSKTQLQYIENERQQLGLQLEALRSQLSPHFLFNCLNTISSLLYKDTGRAERFIRQLAKAYNHTLESRDEPVIPLTKELEFVEAYRYLLSVRFQDQVDVEVKLSDDALASVVPPMTVQLLVENAVKHNVISPEEKLYISIHQQRKGLVISNNKTKKPDRTTSFR